MIYGYENSTAQTYAKEYGYKFKSLGGYQPPVTTAPPVTASPIKTQTTVKTTTKPSGIHTMIASPVPVQTETAKVTTKPITKTTTKATDKPTTRPTTTTTKPTTTLPITPSTTTPPPTAIGDISGNGGIDLQDAIIVAKHLLDIKKLNIEEQKIADFNGDGMVDLYDAIDIAKYLLKNKCNYSAP